MCHLKKDSAHPHNICQILKYEYMLKSSRPHQKDLVRLGSKLGQDLFSLNLVS